jgi:hypothetical protein
MTEGELRELVEDIRTHGQKEPIVIDADTGLILDGRCRDLACRELGKEPQTVTRKFPDEAAKVAFVASLNLKRRHLTIEQRGAIAAELAEHLAQAARDRQLAGSTAAPEQKGKAAELAAKVVGGVSTRTVERARQRMKADPEAHEKAKAGKLGKTKPQPNGGDRASPPRKVNGDLVVALRALDLALPERFNVDAWLADLPKSQRDDALRIARDLVHRLNWFASKLGQPPRSRQIEDRLWGPDRESPALLPEPVPVPEAITVAEPVGELSVAEDPAGLLITTEKVGELQVARPATRGPLSPELIERLRAATSARGRASAFAEHVGLDKSVISRALKRTSLAGETAAKIEAGLATFRSGEQA